MNAKMMAMMLLQDMLVNAREGGEEEGKLWGDVHQVWEYNHILELTSKPNQIQGILRESYLVCERSGIVTAQPRSSVRVDADTKVSDSSC